MVSQLQFRDSFTCKCKSIFSIIFLLRQLHVFNWLFASAIPWCCEQSRMNTRALWTFMAEIIRNWMCVENHLVAPCTAKDTSTGYVGFRDSFCVRLSVAPLSHSRTMKLSQVNGSHVWKVSEIRQPDIPVPDSFVQRPEFFVWCFWCHRRDAFLGVSFDQARAFDAPIDIRPVLLSFWIFFMWNNHMKEQRVPAVK